MTKTDNVIKKTSEIVHSLPQLARGKAFTLDGSLAWLDLGSKLNVCVSFQEFGDSARARKLYEQDSESDDEELEPNPKLEQGKSTWASQSTLGLNLSFKS